MRLAFTINVGCSSVALSSVLVIKILSLCPSLPSLPARINNVFEFVLISAPLGTERHRSDNVIFSLIPFRCHQNQ